MPTIWPSAARTGTAILTPSTPVLASISGSPAPSREAVLRGAPGALDPWWNALPYPRAKRWWLQWPDALPAGDDAVFTGARTAVPERR